MANHSKILARGLQRGERDPDRVLAGWLGPRFMAYRKRFEEAEAGRRLDYPLHLDIDVATVCQLGCPMCPAGREAGENPFPGFGLFMDEALYMGAVREAEVLGVPSIRLGMTGEPLLAPDVDLWALEATRRGFLDVSLITNGQGLDGRTSERLIGAGLTRLMVSVDAATEGTYGLVRPGGDFERLLANVGEFLRARARHGSPLPLLRLSFVVMDGNEGEVGLFGEKFASLADYLTFQDYLNVVGLPETDFKAGPAKRLPAGGEFFCPDPLTRLAIHADGGLFPCCSDFGRLAPLGNLKTASLREVWNSPEARRLAGPGGRGNLACRACLRASGAGDCAAGTDSPGPGAKGPGPGGPVTFGPRPRALAELGDPAGLG
ncbi:MAG: radical SAM protein [Deltaproteobacteria bacterium]|jgi:MoaA/NifB/PqqE/SkfB family radical SAM enzyme|nr:radical SAM protein [Deltaproteobacteria bacterium]